MGFNDELKALAVRIGNQKDGIQTEEATKNAFIMPLINILGYNVFDPNEVTPELNADIGIKKGEKVDYAILKDGKPIILIECKPCKANLDKEEKSQLCRYFQAIHEVRFGILTNGIIYRFFTDLEKPNIMDEKPFLEINLLDIKDSSIEDIKKFCKTDFNLEESLTIAEELKYTKEIKRILSEQLLEPSDEFVKFFASRVYSGILIQSVKDKFKILSKRAFTLYINDRLNEILKSAMSSKEIQPSEETSAQAKEETSSVITVEKQVQTTDDEKEAYFIIKSLLRQTVDSSRINIRDAQSYCAVLFDDNNRKPICRLYFNNPERKQIGIFNAEKVEEKIQLAKLDDLYQYADKLLFVAKSYIQPTVISPV